MKKPGVVAVLFATLSGLLGTAAAREQYQVADIYSGLRQMALTSDPASLGLKPRPSEVWGVVMETGYPAAVASLVVLADGTVSLYFSNGGGILGLGPHPVPARIAKELISFAQPYALQAQKTKIFPLPQKTFTRFYFLIGNRVTSIEAKEDDLGHQRHALSPLFHKAHELISAIRVVDQQRDGK